MVRIFLSILVFPTIPILFSQNCCDHATDPISRSDISYSYHRRAPPAFVFFIYMFAVSGLLFRLTFPIPGDIMTEKKSESVSVLPGFLRGQVENREPGANPGRYRHCKRGGCIRDESRSLGNSLRRLYVRCGCVSQENC